MVSNEQRIIALILIAVSVLLSYFPLPFFTGSMLSFGNVIAVFAVLVFGWRIGIAVSIFASLTLYLHWLNFLALLPNLFEVLIIFFALKKGRNIVISGVVYWLTLGALIVALEYHFFTDYLLQTKWAIVIKYIVNGIINVALGYIFAVCYLYLRKQPVLEQLCLRKFMTMVVFYAVSMTTIVSAYFFLASSQENKLIQLNKQLMQNAEHVSMQVERYIFNTQSNLNLLGELYNKQLTSNNFERQFIELAKQDNGILTMLATDKSGLITATYPASLLEKVKKDGQFTSVATRYYFTEAKRTLEPVVSDVFQGRGFGNDPIVALSAPLILNQQFEGIIEASLDLNHFQSFDIKRLHDSHAILIIDNKNRVIYHSPSTEYQFLQNISQSPLSAHLSSQKDYYYKSKHGVYYIVQQSTPNKLGWHAISLMPRAVYEQEIVAIALRSLFIYLAFIFIFVLLISKLAESISRPITQLADQLTVLKNTEDFAKFKPQISSGIIIEINQLIPAINKYSSELRISLNSLQSALVDADKANTQLADLNDHLTQLVDEKTNALQSALVEANQANLAKSVFLANMSHEVRTPLNGIFGTIQLLQDLVTEPHAKQFIAQALSSSKALLTILNDILDFSKIEEGKLTLESKPFDLNLVLESIYYSLINDANNKGIDITIDHTLPCHMYWCGDVVRVQQIVQNIASNAVKFTKAGSVTVTPSMTPQKELKIAVSDTGIGMSQSTINKLFNRFEQADTSTTREFGGSGLGMSISYNLAQLMKGRIDVFSTVGKGSTFTLVLPLQQATIEDIQLDNKEIAIPNLTHKRILFAEDNKVNQVIIQTMLNKTGCELTIVENGQEALDILDHASFDAIFLDIQMPVLDGLNACQKIRESNTQIPIIALTANVLEHDVKHYLSIGFTAHVSKPVDAHALYLACTRFIANH